MSKSLDPAALETIHSLFLESRYQEALTSFMGIDPGPEINLLKAKILLAQRNFSGALSTISEAVIIDENNPHLYSLRSQIFLYMGRYKDSILAAKHAISLDRENIGAYAFKGQALKHLYLDEEAIETFNEGVAAVKRINHKRDITLDLEKAFLARSCQEYDHGIRYSNYVITSAPNLTSGYIYLGFNLLSKYISTKDLPATSEPLLLSQGIEALDKALALNPKDSIALYYKGFALQISGDLGGALALYNLATDISPDFSKAVIALINVHMLRKEDDISLALVNKFLSITPNSEEALLLKVKILSSKDKCEEALSTIEELILLDSANYYFYYRKALVQSAQNNLPGALATYDLALSLKPQDISILYNKAITLSDLKEHYTALEVIAEIIRLKPDYALAYRAKGHILSELHEYGASFKHFYQTHLEDTAQSPDILMLLSANQFSVAEIWYYNAITEVNKTCLELEGRAQEKIYSRELVDAQTLLLQAIALNPQYVLALIKLSEVESDLGKTEESLKYYSLALEVNKEYANAILNHEKLPHVRAIEREAIASHDHAIALDPGNSILYCSKASSLSKFHIEEGLSESLGMASRLIESSSVPPNFMRGPDEYTLSKGDKRAELLKEVQSLIDSTKALQMPDAPSSTPTEFKEFSPSKALFSMRFASVRNLDSLTGQRIAKMPDSPHYAERHLSLKSGAGAPDPLAGEAPTSVCAASVRVSPLSGLRSSPLHAPDASSRASAQSLDEMTAHLRLSLDGESTTSETSHSHTTSFPTMVLRAKDALKQSLQVATNRYATMDQMNEMIVMLKATMRENNQLRAELEIMKHDYVRTEQVTFAIAHNADSVQHEQMLTAIEADPHLRDYYSSFIRTFQIYFTGFMARNSGEVAAPEFAIPGLSFVPLPPIIEQAISAFESAADLVISTREDNAIIRCLNSIPDIYSFLTTTIPKTACKLCLDPFHHTQILTLQAREHNGIFKLKKYYDAVKAFFCENQTPTPQMELGVTDALKLISAFKKGIIKIEVIATDIDIIMAMSEFVKGNLEDRKITIHTRLASVTEEADDDDGAESYDPMARTGSKSSTTLTEGPSAAPSARASFLSRNGTPTGEAGTVGLTDPSAIALHTADRQPSVVAHELAVPPNLFPGTGIATEPITQRHWYDCFKKCFSCPWASCCGEEVVQNVLPQPDHQPQTMGAVVEAHEATA